MPFSKPGMSPFGGMRPGNRGHEQSRNIENREAVCKERCQANDTCPVLSNTGSIAVQLMEACMTCIRTQNCGKLLAIFNLCLSDRLLYWPTGINRRYLSS